MRRDGYLPVAQAQLQAPRGLALGPDGSHYISDQGANRIRRVGPDGVISTVAGTGAYTYGGDGPGYDGYLLTDLAWSGAIAGTIHRTYNNGLRVSSETVNGGSAAAFGYDDDGLLTSAGGLTLARDPQNGRITAASIGTVEESFTYDAFGALEQHTVTMGGAPVLVDSYVRDALGRITERTETALGVTHTDGYDYDLAGRLTDVYTGGVLATTYDYDENGNRLNRTTDVDVTLGAYDDQDRLLSYGDVTYAYEDSGELLSKMDTVSGETTLYTYDALGNLRAVTLPGGTAIEYVVDGLRRRVGVRLMVASPKRSERRLDGGACGGEAACGRVHRERGAHGGLAASRRPSGRIPLMILPSPLW